MPLSFPFRFVCLSLGGLLFATACQQERAAQKPAPAATAPALADTLAYDSLDQPMAVTPVRRDWHRLEKPTSRRAPLIVYRSSRRPPSLGTDAPPTEARLQDLTLKASEYFQIDPAKPAEVRGREGTIVRIPAGALVDSRQRAVTSSVWLELKECYNASDILLSNLLTETMAGAPLELSGAVLVRATAGGQQLVLAAGRSMQLELAGGPASGALYYGRLAGEASAIRWQEGEAQVAASEQILTTAQQMPSYGKGPADINRLIRYPRQAQERHTEGLVFATFVVDETGRVTNPRILRGLGDGCDEEVLRVLRQTSGRWAPGQQDGRFVKVKMVLPIRFAFQPGMASAPEVAAATEVAPAPEPVEEELAPAANALPITKLGWVSVGQPLSGSIATLFVPGASSDGNHTTVRLVLPGRRVVLAGAPQASGYHFASAPAAGVVVGLRYENGTPFLARHDAANAADTLRFQETTLTDLETTLERLN
ncbi:hypothetical protein GCM10027346_32650 [Hymenobacter seoulensis]